MLLVPVISSDIAAMGFDPVMNELQIQFRTGRIYSYANVPQDLYNSLVTAPSIGSFFAQFIKKFPGLYACTRIDGGLSQTVQTSANLSAVPVGSSILEDIEKYEGLL